jgi:O-antigen ligase
MVLGAHVSQNIRQVTSRTIPAKLAERLVLLLFVSFHLYGIGVMEVGDLSIAIWDVLIIVFFITYIINNKLLNRSVKISSLSLIFVVLGTIFTLWILARALLSPLPKGAFTMAAIQVLNLCTVVILAFSSRIDLSKLNHRILWTAAGLSVLAIALYVSAVLEYQRIIADPSLWRPSIGYVIDQGIVPRLTGLAKDPNFYSLWMSIPIAVGMYCGRRSMLLWVPIALSVSMTLSRTFFIALFFSSLFFTFTFIINNFRKYYIVRSLMILITLILILIANLFWIDQDQNIIHKRITISENAARFVHWVTVSSQLHEQWNPLFGNGLRSTQILLAGKYSHSTYLDVLFETGLVGFSLWVLILGFVAAISFQQMRRANNALIPWVYAFLFLFIYFFSFSLLYHPFIWMVMGVLINQHNPPCGAHVVGLGSGREIA